MHEAKPLAISSMFASVKLSTRAAHAVDAHLPVSGDRSPSEPHAEAKSNRAVVAPAHVSRGVGEKGAVRPHSSAAGLIEYVVRESTSAYRPYMKATSPVHDAKLLAISSTFASVKLPTRAAHAVDAHLPVPGDRSPSEPHAKWISPSGVPLTWS